MYFVLVIK